MNKIYCYNEKTGEYIGERVAQRNPRGTVGGADEFLMPRYATKICPPVAGTRETAVFDGAEWRLVPDFRGCVYWEKTTQERREIPDLGTEPEGSWTDLEPQDAAAVWTGKGWEIPLEELRRRKIDEIRACADAAAAQLKSYYSQAEFETWARQEAGARALRAEMEAAGPDAEFVRSMAAARGVSVAVMVDKILAAVARSVVPGAEIVGMQQRLEDLVLTAASADDLAGIVWPDIDFYKSVIKNN